MPSSKKASKPPKLPVQQLAILSICRFAEPLALTGVFPYLPEMIESFNVPAPDVAMWAGTTSMVFSLAQALTSIQWGRASDRFGRKPVILIALTCAMLTSLGFGFSQTLTQAIVARALAGASNGNVGILRTTVAELVPEKVLQPMAFSVMPMIWAIGSSFGPMLGGLLAVPTRTWPAVFGGNPFFEKFKFALPNIVASAFFTVGIVTGILFLRETLEIKRGRKDWGLALGRALTAPCRGRRTLQPTSSAVGYDEETVPTSPQMARKHSAKVAKDEGPPPWSEVFSYQSSLNIIAYTILAFHAVTFDQLVPVFLHLPHHQRNSGNSSDISEPEHLPFKFWGGFGLASDRIGLLFTAMGIIGILLQFLVFPPVTRRFGTLPCFKVVTATIPFVYVALPYTVLLPTSNSRQVAIFALMFVKTVVAVFAYPCTTILLTNSVTSLRILGTLNGVAVASSAIGRASGPFTSGILFSWSARRGYVVAPWFMLAIIAVLGHVSTYWLVEGDGPSGRDPPEVRDDEDEANADEEIMLLPNDAESNAGQATGVIMGSNSGDNANRDQDYREPEQDEDADESRGLLGSAGLAKVTSNGSTTRRINFGGTSISRISSRSPARRGPG